MQIDTIYICFVHLPRSGNAESHHILQRSRQRHSVQVRRFLKPFSFLGRDTIKSRCVVFQNGNRVALHRESCKPLGLNRYIRVFKRLTRETSRGHIRWIFISSDVRKMSAVCLEILSRRPHRFPDLRQVLSLSFFRFLSVGLSAI